MKEKLRYIWEEQKLLLLVILLIASLFGIFWNDFFCDTKETAFYGVIVGQQYDSEREKVLQQKTMEALELDESCQQVLMDTSVVLELDGQAVPTGAAYTDLMKMTMYLTGGEVDVIFADGTVLDHYNGLGALADFRDILSPEQLEKWSGLLYYAKDNVGQEIACGLRLERGDFVETAPVYLMVSKKAPHMKRMRDFTAFVMTDAGGE